MFGLGAAEDGQTPTVGEHGILRARDVPRTAGPEMVTFAEKMEAPRERDEQTAPATPGPGGRESEEPLLGAGSLEKRLDLALGAAGFGAGADAGAGAASASLSSLPLP